MILVLCAFGAVGLLFDTVDAVGCPVGRGRETQAQLTETYDDVYRKAVPTTMRGKCNLDCILNFIGMLKENGLINAEKFVDALKKLDLYDDSTLENIKTATNNCMGHKHLSENKCATAAFFLQCSSEEIAKLGMDPITMAKAVHAIYFSFRGETYPAKEGYFLLNWPEIDWLPRGKPKNKPAF